METTPASAHSLTDQIGNTDGAHLLYLYNSMEHYIANAASFILSGLRKGQCVVVVDSTDCFERMLDKLRLTEPEENLKRIHFVDHHEFYGAEGTFHFRGVMDQFEKIFKPLMTQGPIRSWGHVLWGDGPNSYLQVHEYECECDSSVNQSGIFGVCCYDARRIPASFHNDLLRKHEYFMTDTTLTRSMLYEPSMRERRFPTFSIPNEAKSEEDWAKKRLEFAHVVSHEVRNPLTVIKAYADILLRQSGVNPAHNEKLKAISDHVDVIDQEIAQIIQTEQMLSNKSLWETYRMKVLPVLNEVMGSMETKARTQNVRLTQEFNIDLIEILGSVIGLKLILSNLISNAIKYSYEGGQVQVSAHLQEERLNIQVRDFGGGMTREKLAEWQRTYDSGSMEKHVQSVGLFLIKKITDDFGGELHIQSELDCGTTITVSFPVVYE
jgi:signal transduction histidine kinase